MEICICLDSGFNGLSPEASRPYVFPLKEHAHGHSSLLGLWRVDRGEQLAEESRETELRTELEEQWRTRLVKRNKRVSTEQGE